MTNTSTPANTKKNYEIDGRCMDCFFNVFERLINKFHFNDDDRKLFYSFYNHITAQSSGQLMPEIHRELNQKFCEISGVLDPYSVEKSESNKQALALYKKWRIIVIESDYFFDTALRLCIAENIMDYGPGNNFDIEKTIEQVMNAKFAIDNTTLLKQHIKEAKSILNLGDNAGEIVFDKLVVLR